MEENKLSQDLQEDFPAVSPIREEEKILYEGQAEMILSPGGGIVLQEENRKLLQEHLLYRLSAAFSQRRYWKDWKRKRRIDRYYKTSWIFIL